ncbi:pentatricopeptide repeat-containing protein At3g02490, mitochondrial-like [Impatiens glandulifera]|nr:pentatricopeptide repeat-containing protein At3g02490, mitochondrial-like [Impatiens glandulifera]
MARVLGRQDCIDKFWKVVNEMRDAGYEMEGKTYIETSVRFIKMKMIKDAVNLYEFAMDGANKPSMHDSTFLLKKIVVSKELDMELFGNVVKKYADGGSVFANSSLSAVLKSLASVGRYHECNKVLKTMKSGGDFLPGENLQTKIAFKLSSKKKKEEAGEFLVHMEASGGETNHRTWASLVRGYCIAGDLEEASRSFRESIEKEGISGAGYSLDLLVNEYCFRKRSAIDGFKLLSNSVKQNGVKPWHSTYKLLTEELLARRNFNEAVHLLGLMKNDGFPPFLDPFIKYVTKKGTTDEALMFLKGMTVHKFPSISVVLRVFETYMEKGKHSEAQDLLSKCPSFIRNHADVLDLFHSMKPKTSSSVASVTC